MVKISIIVRTFNEEYWIPILISALEKQSEQSFEVINVDNNSYDNTLKQFKKAKFPVKFVTIDKYIPGKSLNIGCEVANGKYLIFLSAHCIPNSEKWLENLIVPFKIKDVVASYGRQIPCSNSHPADKRDLFITFPAEDNLQVKNTFFHNANSAILKSTWEEFPFDESLSNIEDRIFGETIIKSGKKIYYSSKAEVVHFHGIHQTGNITRLSGVIDILDKNKITSYENSDFIKIDPNVIKISILSKKNYLKSHKIKIPNDSFLLSNINNLKIKNAIYLDFSSNLKIIDILRQFSLKNNNNYDYLLFFDFKNYDSNKIEELINQIKNISVLGAIYCKKITNHVVFDDGVHKELVGEYHRNRDYSINEINILNGIILHKSLLELPFSKIINKLKFIYN
jgi:rhamnosyltransferase